MDIEIFTRKIIEIALSRPSVNADVTFWDGLGKFLSNQLDLIVLKNEDSIITLEADKLMNELISNENISDKEFLNLVHKLSML